MFARCDSEYDNRGVWVFEMVISWWLCLFVVIVNMIIVVSEDCIDGVVMGWINVCVVQ